MKMVLNNHILIKKVKSHSIESGMKIIKQKYPYAKLITYKYDKDFRLIKDKDYKNRIITIAFIKNIKKVL